MKNFNLEWDVLVLKRKDLQRELDRANYFLAILTDEDLIREVEKNKADIEIKIKNLEAEAERINDFALIYEDYKGQVAIWELLKLF